MSKKAEYFYLIEKALLGLFGPYYNSKLELKSNLNEILPVNCKFFYAESQT